MKYNAKVSTAQKIAHELRGPMQSVMLCSDILQEKWAVMSDDDRKKLLKNISDSLQIMNRMITSIEQKESEGLGTIDPTLSHEKINVIEIIEEAVKNIETIFGNYKISIYKKFETKKCYVLADKFWFEQVIINLLSNSVKFSEQETIINIIVKEQDEACVIEIRDQGLGVSESELSSIFQPYVRGSSKPRYGFHSSGLGLAIVADVVSKLNGYVRARSNNGVGLTIEIVLPVISQSLSNV